MNPRSAAEVAFGVAGIWLLVSRIPDFGLNLALWPVGPDGVLHWAGVIHFALVVICGVGLLGFRRALAAWLVPMPEPDVGDSVVGLQAAAFSIVGVVLLAHGLAELLGRLAVSLWSPGHIPLDWLAIGMAQTAVGLLLFLGAGGLAQVWRALRRKRGSVDTEAG
ncbi:MAG TPA: hypothetical protein VJU17_07455 [Gemmatimonadales bacterium]|nr:hypothetical protein [Gemmatimonadales bacterium]